MIKALQYIFLFALLLTSASGTPAFAQSTYHSSTCSGRPSPSSPFAAGLNWAVSFETSNKIVFTQTLKSDSFFSTDTVVYICFTPDSTTPAKWARVEASSTIKSTRVQTWEIGSTRKTTEDRFDKVTYNPANGAIESGEWRENRDIDNNTIEESKTTMGWHDPPGSTLTENRTVTAIYTITSSAEGGYDRYGNITERRNDADKVGSMVTLDITTNDLVPDYRAAITRTEIWGVGEKEAESIFASDNELGFDDRDDYDTALDSIQGTYSNPASGCSLSVSKTSLSLPRPPIPSDEVDSEAINYLNAGYIVSDFISKAQAAGDPDGCSNGSTPVSDGGSSATPSDSSSTQPSASDYNINSSWN